MLKKKRIKRSNIVKLFRKNYGVLSTVFVLFLVIFVMFDSFVVNAMDYPQSGTYSDSTLIEFYSMTSPYSQLASDGFSSYYTLQGYDASNLKTIGFGWNALDLSNVYGSGSNRYVIPTSVTMSGQTVGGGANKHMFTFEPSSPYMQTYSFSIEGAGTLALVSNGSNSTRWIVSEQPFYLFGCAKDVQSGEWYFYENESTSSGSGYYIFNIDSYQNIILTDMPIYLASTDGDSGFQNFVPSGSGNDFDLNGNNIDLNYLMADGSIVDPNGQPSESDIERVSKSNMIFTSSDTWNGNALEGMTHTYNFNPNEYMKLHGEQFQIVVEHGAVYKDSTMNTAVDFTFPTYTMKVDMLLAQSNSGTFTIPLDLHNMKDSNNVSIRQYLLTTINTLTGTSEQYIDINSMGTESGNTGADGGNIVSGSQYGDYMYDENNKKVYLNKPTNNKVVLKGQYDNTVEQFRLYAKIYVRTAPPDYNYESDTNDTSYNLVNGSYNIEKNGGATQLYEPEAGSGVQTPTIPSGTGGTGTSLNVSSGGISNILKDVANPIANAIIESGAIQNTVSPSQTAYGGTIESGAVTVQTGGAGFQMPQQQWNQFGNLITEMSTDLTTLNNDNGIVSTANVVKNVVEGVLPNDNGTAGKLWSLIFAGIAGSIAIALWNKAAHNH